MKDFSQGFQHTDLHGAGYNGDSMAGAAHGIATGPSPKRGGGVTTPGGKIIRGGLTGPGEHPTGGGGIISISNDPYNPAGPEQQEPGSVRRMSEQTMNLGKMSPASTPADKEAYNDLASQTGQKPYTGLTNSSLPRTDFGSTEERKYTQK